MDWSHIIATHGPNVWRLVYRITGDAEAARDCYQDTFLAALRESQRRRVEHWGGLLAALASRRAIDHLRRRIALRRRMVCSSQLDALTPPVDATPVDAGARHEELRATVRRLLAQMPPRQAQAFWLRYLDDMPVAHIARELGTSDRNVAILLHRARMRLRRELTALTRHDTPTGEQP